jgi:asparagine synthase (glutamine-hydrolysing)
MCGIVGVLNLTNPAPVDAELLRVANAALHHRGPDGSGEFVEADVGMAMRRLSIIDVAQGHQPMANEDGSVRVVYNGEIYNHEDLRRDLEARGHRFHTHADTEVLVHGYEEWGRDGLLERLRGMFAFAIWDDKRRAVFLARDRMGIKPLYTAEYDGRFYFASEIRSILLLSEMPRRPNLNALGLYMRVGFVTAPHTILEGLTKLPPAHYLWIEDGKVSSHEYWTLSYEPTNRDAETAIVEGFRERLEDSIRTHLMSEVPLGALLSGGVDSTTTVAFMGRMLSEPVNTVTVGFAGASLDETELAKASARELGTEHHTVVFTHDTMADYPSVIRAQEEPFGRPTNAALYYLFKACREHGLTVMMTGEGADELLGGYGWHRKNQSGRLQSAISRLPLGLRRAFAGSGTLRAIGQSGRALLRSTRGEETRLHRRFAELIRIGDCDVGVDLLSSDVRSAVGADAGQSIIDGWEDWLACVRGQPEFGQLLWLQSRTRMPDYIIQGLDKHSMAHSVEARPPLLDHLLWEYCAALPSDIKLRDGTEKYLLRQAGMHIVPEAARTRRKKPLRVPYERWIAKQRLPDWAECALDTTQLRRTGLFDPRAVSQLRQRVQAGERRNVALLSAVLNLQTWVSVFIDAP